MLVLFMLLVTLPLSLIFWLSTALFLGSNDDEVGLHSPTPWRWLLSLLLPVLIIKHGINRNSLCRSGAVAAFFVGFLLVISNYCYFGALLAFFISASKVTTFRQHKKRRFEEDFKEGGCRNWVQVLCNGGIAAELALFFIVEGGCWEPPVNFSQHYNVSWLCMSVLGALACSSGDTYASEIGSVIGSGDPFLITTFKRVPRGTNGAVSVGGVVVSVLGGAVVGLAYYVILLLCCQTELLAASPPQWPIILVSAAAGLVGSLIDSLLGATLQFSGYDPVKKVIVESPGEHIQQISGVPLLCNHSVNLLSAFITGLITPRLAYTVWGTLL